MSNRSDLLPCTIVIEWENAIDVDDQWAYRAIAGLERELEMTAPLMQTKPVVSYLFNMAAVNPEIISRAIAEAGAKLFDYAQVEIVPTNGLSYYELKNHGAARAETEVSIFLDSDAAPRRALLLTGCNTRRSAAPECRAQRPRGWAGRRCARSYPAHRC